MARKIAVDYLKERDAHEVLVNISYALGESEPIDATVFIDAYTDGYGKADSRITGTIRQIMGRYGIPLDETYTGKAFTGMQDYIEEHPEEMKGRNILFIHTGGTPLFFDLLRG